MESEATRREGEAGGPTDRLEGSAPERLAEGWLCGRNCEVGGPPSKPVRVELVLMHPNLGVALLDTEGRAQVPEDRVGALRERLEQARFGTIFGGHLPILQGSVAPGDLPSLPDMLAKAFRELPPLTVGGGAAWVETLARLMVPANRLWTDNLRGAPPGSVDDGDRDGNGLLRRPATFVPMRRAAPSEDRRAGFERKPRPEDRTRSVRWLASGGAFFGAVALAGSLAWVATLPGGRADPDTAVPPQAFEATPNPGGVGKQSAPPAAKPTAEARPPAPPAASPVSIPVVAAPVALPPTPNTPAVAEDLPLPPPLPPPPAARMAPPPQRPRSGGTAPAGRAATPGRNEVRPVTGPARSRPRAAPSRRVEPGRGA
jgi:hypothetical protein